MSIGAPSNLGTLLIQRLDAVLGTTLGQQANLVSGARPSAVTQPGNPENPDALRNPNPRHPREAVDAAGAQGRGQAAIGKATGATALDDRIGRAATYHGATASAPTTLGFAARIILALLAHFPDADPAVQGRAPLLGGQNPGNAGSALPGSPAAAAGGGATAGGANASGTTAPQSGALPQAASKLPGSLSTLGTWATLASTLNQPGALAARLAQSLGQAVQGSGLFYESHLAALSLGKASPQDLAREPQGRLSPQNPGAAGASSGQTAASGTAQGASAADKTMSMQSAGASSQALSAQAAQTAQAAQGGTPSTQAQGAQTAHSAHAGTPPPMIPGIDPQTQLLVRQQLEVLAHQAFAWQGEAWPGAGMRWEVQRRPGENSDPDATAPDHWATRLNLSLPSLGEVQARLSLVGDQLVMRLAAPQAAAQLGGDLEALRSRLLAHGLQASQLSVVASSDLDNDAATARSTATPAAAEAPYDPIQT